MQGNNNSKLSDNSQAFQPKAGQKKLPKVKNAQKNPTEEQQLQAKQKPPNKYKRVQSVSQAAAGSDPSQQCAQGAQNNSFANGLKPQPKVKGKDDQAVASHCPPEAKKTPKVNSQPQQQQPLTYGAREYSQLENLTFYMQKRLTKFKEDCTKASGRLGNTQSKEIYVSQQQILRGLIAQVAILTGVCGPPQTENFKKSGTIRSLKQLFVPSEPVSSERQTEHQAKQKSSSDRHTQTKSEVVDSSLKSEPAIKPMEVVVRCECKLTLLQDRLEAMKQELDLKKVHSQHRQTQKENLLSMVSGSQSDKKDQVDTKKQISDVIAKERFIQADLQACINKLAPLQSALAQKVERTFGKINGEFQAILQLVELLAEIT